MADLLGTIGEALFAYWSSPFALIILSVAGGSMATLAYVFVSNARNAKLRVSLLTALYALTIFFWSFLAASFLLCVSASGMVAYRANGVRAAVTGAVFAAYLVTAVLSWFAWRRGSAAILKRFAPREAGEDERWVRDYVEAVAGSEGLRDVRLGIVDREEPLAMAVGGTRPSVLVSTGLLAALDGQETQAVVTHELMHLRNHDAQFKVVSTILSRALFFDPFSKFFDPAVHREREYLADEMSGRTTGRPAALASALVKIAAKPAPSKAAWGISIYSPRGGMFSRYPPLRERVDRLLSLSELLSANGEPIGASRSQS